MKTTGILVLSSLLPVLGACALWQEEELDLADVPAAVIEAAQTAVPGIEIKAAESKDRNGRTVYEIDGKADGVKHEVRVTADGEVLKVKTEG